MHSDDDGCGNDDANLASKGGSISILRLNSHAVSLVEDSGGTSDRKTQHEDDV
jgi:hypothetical protein